MGVVLLRLTVIPFRSIRLEEKVPPKTELIKTEETVVCTRTRFQISQVNAHSVGHDFFFIRQSSSHVFIALKDFSY